MKLAGIYKIEINNRVYVGSTSSFADRRITHLSRLRCNKHANKDLQRAYNLYNEAKITFIEETNNLQEREAYWIAYYDSITNGFNKTADTTCKYTGRKIYVFDNVINDFWFFRNLKECASMLGVTHDTIQMWSDADDYSKKSKGNERYEVLNVDILIRSFDNLISNNEYIRDSYISQKDINNMICKY